ncbi:mannonate dehydratase [Paraglaciecola sp. L3A3]|uniref:mannonate dehydratase n=1 Tax=Paraglaciecola sp. L3A3 TaxID=2686358 RepID=UPI00131DC034|nr:mannonate dehydratase [Paraglaciecola sp. L3A3]
MIETWRWFGPKDTVSLANIKQAGATGVVTSLHHVATGDAWSLDEIMARKNLIEDNDLTWSVVESVPLHNDIKLRTGDYLQHIENYKISIKNLGKAGIASICYNFMPVVDWTRTNLLYSMPNKAKALRFEMSDFAAYDVYILERDNAEQDYAPELLAKAKTRLDAMSEQEKALLEKNIIAGLPGGEGSYSRDSIRQAIAEFIQLGNEGMRRNLILFLEAIIPTAEEAGVQMCIHPDDPPFSLFGLPRVVSTAEDVRLLTQAVPSRANGLTLCAGSFGARCDNNLVEIAKEFSDIVHFVHLRNVKREPDGSFFESDHLDGDNDMIGLITALLNEQKRRKLEGRADYLIPMRPDHGHLMGEELEQQGINPGYSFTGRLRGLAELRGVITTLEHLQNQAS